MAGKKKSESEEPKPIQKSSTEPEPKLIKYPKRFNILVSREPKPNPIRTEVFWVPESITLEFRYAIQFTQMITNRL